MNIARFFAGLSAISATLIQLHAAEPVARYWFDNSEQTVVFSPGNLEIDVNGLSSGIHSLNVRIESDNIPVSVASRLFLKGKRNIAGEKFVMKVMVDNNLYMTEEYVSTGADNVYPLNLDLKDLPDGIHKLGIAISDQHGVFGARESFFLKVPTADQYAGLKAYYQLDGKDMDVPAVAIGNTNTYSVDLDMAAIPTGLHSLTTYMVSPAGLMTSVHTAWFVKIPIGGEGVKTYKYWVNDNVASVKTVDLSSVANPFELISLVEVDEEPLRTTSYTFAIEEEQPVVYACNDFHMQFIDLDHRVIVQSQPFTDMRVRKEVADVELITDDIRVLNPSPKDGEIKWYCFDAEAGDSLAIHLDRAAMYELYAPDAQALLQISKADAVNNRGLSLVQTGKYYLAVHDVSDRYGVPKLHFTHIPKHALLSWTPEKASASGLLFMEIQGNGFDQLKSLAIRKDGVLTEPTEWVAHDRYTLTARFDVTKANITVGKYDLVATFEEDGASAETIEKAGVIEFTEKGKSNISVKIEAPHIVQTPYEVYVDVTNDSEQSCWGVPLNLAFNRPAGGVSIEFKDFYPYRADSTQSAAAHYITDNLLNTGEDGAFIPLIVPYIGPGETIRLTIGLTSPPHEIIRMYAWNGQPWSDEFDEILSEGFDFEEINNLTPSNILTARALVYFKTYEAEFGSQTTTTVGQDDKKSIEDIEPTNTAADHAADVAKTIGATIGEIADDSRLHNLNSTLDTYGIDLNDEMSDSLNNYQDDIKQAIPTPASIVGISWGHGFGYTAAMGYLEKGVSYHFNMPDRNDVDCYQSGDPNDITGYVSPSGDTSIGIGVKTVQYTIEFENDPEIATAPASVIKVDNVLDKEMFDLNSFKALKMIIGGEETELPDGHHFVKTIDMRPSINAIAELTFDYEASTGTASWSIRSLDPMTMEPTKYMEDGILPVNDDSGRGTGYLIYSIDLLPGLSDRTEIANSALITFDDNEPIATPVWTNVTDYTLPQADINVELSDDNMSCRISIDGNDAGSGIWYYDLYTCGADDKSWRIIRNNITDNNVEYTSERSLEDAYFLIVPTDRAGNSNSAGLLIKLGDADGNGKVDATDVVIIRNYYTGKTKSIIQINADITRDHAIDSQDALSTINTYLDKQPNKLSHKRTRKK